MSPGGPGAHQLAVAVVSQCSLALHDPPQGAVSHRPVRGLQTVSATQVAMHPPALRCSAAAPMAAAVIVLAPTAIEGAHPESGSSAMRRTRPMHLDCNAEALSARARRRWP